MKHYAEYVGKGHPDRLCDQIVNDIVLYVISKDKDALCGLECAVHTNKVFVDGRIAAGKNKRVINEKKIKEIVREVYHRSGYGIRPSLRHYTGQDFGFHPFPEELDIILNVCIERLSDEERDLRSYSDDQNVVNGYAINNKETDYLPVAHYLALYIGERVSNNQFLSDYGRDFKVLVSINEENGKLSWDR